MEAFRPKYHLYSELIEFFHDESCLFGLIIEGDYRNYSSRLKRPEFKEQESQDR
jgi:hypothetical protein